MLAFPNALAIFNAIANDMVSIEAKKETEKQTEGKAEQKRKEIFNEATHAIHETQGALKLLDNKKDQEALEALERRLC